MAGLALDESKEEQPIAPTKRRGFLSRAFYAAISIGTGMSIGFAAKTCATALLCTAGAPATTTAIVAAASAGLLVGTFHAYRGYRREKQIFRDTKFFSRQTLATTMTHAALASAASMVGLHYGDNIKEYVAELSGAAAEYLGFAPEAPLPAPEITTDIGSQPAAPEIETTLNITAPAPVDAAPEMPATITLVTPDIIEPSTDIITEPAAPVAEVIEDIVDSPEILVTPEPAPADVPTLESANFEVMTDIGSLEMPDITDTTPLPEDYASARINEAFNYLSEPAQLPEITQYSIEALPEFGQPATYTVSAGDNMWNVIEAHYGLTSNTDIQRYVDAIAVFNGMEGVSANHIDIGDTIQLPEFGYVTTTEELQLNWRALDADALKMRMG